MTDQEQIKAEGYAAGLASPHGMQCPYDGRTRAGKAWWDGFMAGDAERCAAKQSQPVTETVQCEVNFATGEFREVNPGPWNDVDGCYFEVGGRTYGPYTEEEAEEAFGSVLSGSGEPQALLRKQRDSLAEAVEATQARLLAAERQRDALADALRDLLLNLGPSKRLVAIAEEALRKAGR